MTDALHERSQRARRRRRRLQAATAQIAGGECLEILKKQVELQAKEAVAEITGRAAGRCRRSQRVASGSSQVAAGSLPGRCRSPAWSPWGRATAALSRSRRSLFSSARTYSHASGRP